MPLLNMGFFGVAHPFTHTCQFREADKPCGRAAWGMLMVVRVEDGDARRWDCRPTELCRDHFYPTRVRLEEESALICAGAYPEYFTGTFEVGSGAPMRLFPALDPEALLRVLKAAREALDVVGPGELHDRLKQAVADVLQ